MRALRRALARLAGLVTRRRRERDFDEELRSHVEMDTDEGIRSGLAPEEARRRALVMLGGVQQTRDAYADGVTLPSLESVLRDVRFAVRSWRRRRDSPPSRCSCWPSASAPTPRCSA
ncbi:MAG TPA: permease prefix domain 1-containing protein [Vicinamibacterales bacterium]|nr:permease prefix domain 1-containing protein [Vicinamibacterales bacterium]